MSRLKIGGLTALVLAAVLVVPAAASAVSISASGSPYTGTVNVRLSSASAVLTTSTGTITCTSSGGQLGSFGTGSVTSSSLSTTAAQKGNLTRLSFGNPLLDAAGTPVHDTTTTVLSSGAPNTTPRCASTIAAVSGGCVAETPSTTNPVSAYYAGTNAFIQLQLQVNLYCRDSGGAAANCAYQTYSTTAGTPGPVTSNAIPFSTSGPATATFSSVKVYRSSGSTLCPSLGTFTASYQLYTGWYYGGGAGVYVSSTP